MTSVEPDLAVIVPWHDRFEVRQTLETNREHFAAADAEVVVVGCGGDHGWLARTLLDDREASVPTKLVAFDPHRFNKSLAVNLGVAHTKADTLLLLDADIFLEPQTLPDLRAGVSDESYATVATVKETDPAELATGAISELGFLTSILLDDGRAVTFETSSRNMQTGARSGPGLAMTRRKHFLAVGGMNSGLVDWGWEDIDLAVRLELGLGLNRRPAGMVRHFTHSSTPNARASESQNMARAIAAYHDGVLTGTYSADLAKWESSVRVYA